MLSADTPSQADRLGRGDAAAFLAEVVAHRAADTPFCIGIFGPPGSGKSSFLAGILDAVERLASSAADAGLATPFLGNLVVARLEAKPAEEPIQAILRTVAAALGASHPKLADDARHAGRDPKALAREAAERLNAVQQGLDTERAGLDALTRRRANLVEHVLFEAPGSGVETYALGNRGRIERRWRGFGVTGEPMTAFKESVRDANEVSRSSSRWLGWLRVFWAYRGQARLLVLAVALLLAAWGLGALIDNESKLIDTMRGSSETMARVADWLQARWAWLRPARTALDIAAVVSLAINIARGLRFLVPVHRGAALLRTDLESRGRELDSQVARQTSRVDALVRETERAIEDMSDAEARLAGRTGSAGGANPAEHDGTARGFLGALSQAMQAGADDRLVNGEPGALRRIVVGIDGLDLFPDREAAAFLQEARNLLGGHGFVTVVAAERAHLASGLADADPALATARLNRIVQLPYTLAAEGEGWSDAGAFARCLIEPEAGVSGAVELDPAVSRLDRPWTEGEIAAVEALAPLGGATPRSVKRFVNLYRVARADPRMRDGDTKDFGSLAVGLAIQSAGLPMVELDSKGFGQGDDPYRQARAAVASALGTVLTAQDGKRGAEIARTYGTGG